MVAAARSRPVSGSPRANSSRTLAISDVWSKTVESTTPFCTHGEITTAGTRAPSRSKRNGGLLEVLPSGLIADGGGT
jgi:hypothetical protein